MITVHTMNHITKTNITHHKTKQNKKRERERGEMVTGLDGSRMDPILIGSSRSKGLDCIFDQQHQNHCSQEKESKKQREREREKGQRIYESMYNVVTSAVQGAIEC